jgi:hypothetical protein
MIENAARECGANEGNGIDRIDCSAQDVLAVGAEPDEVRIQ